MTSKEARIVLPLRGSGIERLCGEIMDELVLAKVQGPAVSATMSTGEIVVEWEDDE